MCNYGVIGQLREKHKKLGNFDSNKRIDKDETADINVVCSRDAVYRISHENAICHRYRAAGLMKQILYNRCTGYLLYCVLLSPNPIHCRIDAPLTLATSVIIDLTRWREV